jgi:hypothetical protein
MGISVILCHLNKQILLHAHQSGSMRPQMLDFRFIDDVIRSAFAAPLLTPSPYLSAVDSTKKPFLQVVFLGAGD